MLWQPMQNCFRYWAEISAQYSTRECKHKVRGQAQFCARLKAASKREQNEVYFDYAKREQTRQIISHGKAASKREKSNLVSISEWKQTRQIISHGKAAGKRGIKDASEKHNKGNCTITQINIS